MSSKTLSFLAFGFALAVIGANCGGDGEKKPRISVAEKYGLTEAEASAYKVCQRQMSGKKLSIKGQGTVWPVPKEICACQSSQMVKTFKDGKYASHANVIQLLSDEPGATTLNSADLISPSNPEAQFMSVTLSIVNCVTEYRDKNTRRLEDHIVENQEMCERSSNGQVKEVCDSLRAQGRI